MINKIDKLAKTHEEKKKAQINKIINETLSYSQHQRNTENHIEYYKKWHANKSNNLEALDKFLEAYNLRLNQEEIENLYK